MKYTYTPKDYEVGLREISAVVTDGELNTTTSWNVSVEKVEDESEELLGYSYDFWGLVFAIISGVAAIIVFVFGVVKLRKRKGKLQEYMEKIEEMPFIFSPSDIRIMRQVKDAMDPDDLLNPGKIFPAA